MGLCLSPQRRAFVAPCRNFYYITMLRDPVSRYLSEWKHVQRGATWKTALHMCDGRAPTQDELPACYSGDDWAGVTLLEFMDCPSNLANNRQVRMLADLSLVGCYNLSSMNESERGRILLESARSNLRSMAFYGLTEFQRKTQYLFERTFSLRFIAAFTQINSTRAAGVGIGAAARRRIEELNLLDVQLYEYAKDLFLQRFQVSRRGERRELRERRVQRRKQRRWRKEQRVAFLSPHRTEGEEEQEEEEEEGRRRRTWAPLRTMPARWRADRIDLNEAPHGPEVDIGQRPVCIGTVSAIPFAAMQSRSVRQHSARRGVRESMLVRSGGKVRGCRERLLQ
ncbi:hypothetical protein AAFF_G00114710 [Aldrovandia affinis]|uniref:Heparan-sulfate 6-O-sulfotransferase n=1 Tax=Aldrovandia affinis TaxID=143900 RepID=A0AAD7RT64_9TELE|nr:hypothetical protein AAFF_G00114710 [Aldrovandia affinis]